MKKKINVIIKAPGAKPYAASIEMSEKSVRSLIGTDTKVFRYDGDACVICAKNVSGLDYNCEWFGRDFYGTMIWVGYSEKGFTPFPDEFRVFRTLNPALFEEYERAAEKKRRIGCEILFVLLTVGLWAWLGIECARQFFELL